MSVSALILEAFDDTPEFAASAAPSSPAVDPADAYMDGFAAGEATALARFESAERVFGDAAAALDEQLKALAPASERALAEALTTLARALFPALCERGFAEEASAAIARAFAGAVATRVDIAAPESQVEALADALGRRRFKTEFTISGDPSLSTAAARVSAGRGGLDFDLDAAREAALAALATALEGGRQ